ncbi:hypothetical protein VT84_23420 [Gemmata sp. SH-PL17]|uniref:hypothetical protein n=1 Tax=Gemmata sp. SH-PL17 TaxID=1630693 RepID=UPI00078B6D6A|nr:hypothetical protein [Gemmata sp. SH-PL17]AMV27369.1 hypothetical protein VT84_23420 [Gemmata sp. SH-PL17]
MPTGDVISVLSHGLFVSSGGTCDYPAESDVLLGVEYANGGMTGTFGTPDPTATSVLDRILSAVVSKVQLAGVTVGPNLMPVVKRKLPKKEEKVDADYQVTVSGSENVDATRRIAFGHVFRVEYTVEITLITPNADQLTHLADHTVWREATRAAFMAPKPLAGVPEVKRLEIVEAPFLDRSLLSQGYDYDQIQLTVWTFENRSS